jgi:hypothetical protein
MRLSNELQEALARSRRRPRSGTEVLRTASERLCSGSKMTLCRADDPDDSIDSDDAGPRLSVTLKESPNSEIYASPAVQAEQTGGRHPTMSTLRSAKSGVRFRGRIVSRHRSLAVAQRESRVASFSPLMLAPMPPIVKVPAQQYWPG